MSTTTIMAEINSNFSDSDYANIFDWFTNNSDHEFVIHANLIKIIESLHKCDDFLDIGTGNGHIARLLYKSFQRTILLEPNQEYFKMYENIGYDQLICEKYLDWYTVQTFDFVLCSHMLYHVNVGEWEPFIKKMYDMVNIGGICVIILISDKGNMHQLRYSLNEDYHNSKVVIKILNSLRLKYQVIPYGSTLRSTVTEFPKFQYLVRLFAIDDCFSREQYNMFHDTDRHRIDDLINSYVSSLYSENSGQYCAEFSGDIVVIHRT
jgi:SAM-dependent methyltransferase